MIAAAPIAAVVICHQAAGLLPVCGGVTQGQISKWILVERIHGSALQFTVPAP
jgi:hypothetical protein